MDGEDRIARGRCRNHRLRSSYQTRCCNQARRFGEPLVLWGTVRIGYVENQGDFLSTETACTCPASGIFTIATGGMLLVLLVVAVRRKLSGWPGAESRALRLKWHVELDRSRHARKGRRHWRGSSSHVQLDSLAHRSRMCASCPNHPRVCRRHRQPGRGLAAAHVGGHRLQWRGRFIRERLDGLCDEPPPGSPRRVTEAQVETRSLASGAERSRHVFASPAGLDSVDQRPLGIPVSRPGFTARAAIITGKPASRRSSVFDGFPTPSPIASVGISSRANPCKKATAANTFP